jgi:hypothetical protein
MSALDLVFSRPAYAGGPLDLVFGSTDGPPPALPLTVTITVTLSAPVVTCSVVYDNRLPPLVSATVSAPHQVAAPADAAPITPWGRTEALDSAPPAAWQAADTTGAAPSTPWVRTSPRGNAPATRWGAARVISEALDAVYQQCTALDRAAAGHWQTADGRSVNVFSPHQVANPAEHVHAARMQQAQTAVVAIYAPHQVANHAARVLRVRWQEARQLPTGLTVWVPIDGGGGLTPHVPDLNLVFACPAYVQGEPVNLVFGRVCGADPEPPDATVIVPVKRVYIVINNADLRRVADNVAVPCLSMSLALDTESWTWGFNASAPLEAEDLLLDGNPVELRAWVNGTEIRLVVKSVERERVFGQVGLRVTGYGRNALLGEDYMPQLAFGNTIARTAQQLANDVLTVNGVPLGWAVDWQLTDWLVPAGVFAHTGTYQSALTAIAAAAGGYIRPHASDMSLSVLHRYPLAPWDWATATPDFELPAAVTTREGIRRVRKPEYNRVYVLGEGSTGVMGRVTRAGTAGDMLAQMIVDPLITAEAAARQRGLVPLADVGDQVPISLRLPVLPETGIILPGTLLRYVDGGVTRLGLTRGVSVDVQMPAVYQTLEIESHE